MCVMTEMLGLHMQESICISRVKSVGLINELMSSLGMSECYIKIVGLINELISSLGMSECCMKLFRKWTNNTCALNTHTQIEPLKSRNA